MIVFDTQTYRVMKLNHEYQQKKLLYFYAKDFYHWYYNKVFKYINITISSMLILT